MEPEAFKETASYVLDLASHRVNLLFEFVTKAAPGGLNATTREAFDEANQAMQDMRLQLEPDALAKLNRYRQIKAYADLAPALGNLWFTVIRECKGRPASSAFDFQAEVGDAMDVFYRSL